MVRVSMGLPVYNGARLLPRALDSLLSQTFEDFEIVITDNASTDSTEDISRDYAKNDPRVRYYRNETNLGASLNFKRAFDLATGGEFFRWAAHDDYLAEDYLERCVKVLDANPEAVLCFSGMAVVNDDKTIRRTRTEPIAGAESSDPRVRFHRIVWSLRDPTSPVFGLARRSALQNTGLVRNAPEPDRILLGELSLLGPIHQIEDILFYRGKAPGQYDRDNWAWLDPRNINRPKLGTIRVTQHHLAALRRSHLRTRDKLMLGADMLAAFAVNRTRYRVRLFYKRRIRPRLPSSRVETR